MAWEKKGYEFILKKITETRKFIKETEIYDVQQMNYLYNNLLAYIEGLCQGTLDKE